MDQLLAAPIAGIDFHDVSVAVGERMQLYSLVKPRPPGLIWVRRGLAARDAVVFLELDEAPISYATLDMRVRLVIDSHLPLFRWAGVSVGVVVRAPRLPLLEDDPLACLDAEHRDEGNVHWMVYAADKPRITLSAHTWRRVGVSGVHDRMVELLVQRGHDLRSRRLDPSAVPLAQRAFGRFAGLLPEI